MSPETAETEPAGGEPANAVEDDEAAAPASRARARATAEAVLETVPRVMRAIRGHMRAGRVEGITVPQFRAMLYIWRQPGTDLSSVAEHLGASMPAVSELVSRLVRDGLVVRDADPASRRRIRLALSPNGERELAEARGQTLDWLEERLAAETPEQLARIEAAFRELRAALEDVVAD